MLHHVIVATDSDRIYDEVMNFGGKAVMTKQSHQNGTERCAEVLARTPGYDYVINIQGDEPFIRPEQIDEVAALLDGQVEIATLVRQIQDPDLLDQPTEVKVVLNQAREAVYFSRSCIPYVRNYPRNEWLDHATFYKHIGIYAYRADVLQKISRLPPGNLEVAESLEQLRWIENGYQIQTAITAYDSTMIDTPEDLEKVLREYRL